ncbi:protein DA1-related 1-like isoform X3 [Silene latifolia]|uniref:protein DA1-related 1-like isoform X3 n=2 Tax=Silene latifolia TaxID=37657 RepID=UPI003D776EF5
MNSRKRDCIIPANPSEERISSVMGWLSKIFGGSGHHHRFSEEQQYPGRYGEDPHWDGPTTSGDTWSDYDNEDIDRAIALSLIAEEEIQHEKKEEDPKGKKVIDHDCQLEEDELLAKALQESLNMESPPRSPPHPPESPPISPPPPPKSPWRSPPPRSPPRYDRGNMGQPYPFFSYGSRSCTGCGADIGHGRYLSCMGGFWHPECFRCHVCSKPISDYEFSMSRNRPFHKSCYKEQHHPKCDVCRNYIPTNATGLIEYRAHPFWMQKYCPSHERDMTPRCCSCERMEPRDTEYLVLDDGRKLCLECLDSSIMDTNECQPLYIEIREFYEGLNMKVEQQIPLLLVERQALNEAMEGEKPGHHHLPETRGLCLSEEQTVRTILRRPRIGGGHRIIDMITEPYRLVRRCEVTAILILFGLPRLLTGSILAHEMMHAWLRLNGYPNLKPEIEEGICQVLAHMWLESEIMAGSTSTSVTPSSSSESGSSSSSGNSSKKGKRSEFEKKLGDFFKHQIESDTSAAYGEGFRLGNQAVLKYGLRRTLDHMRLTGTFP